MGLIEDKVLPRRYLDISFNGSDTSKNVDVSSIVRDARKYQLYLADPNYEVVFANLKATSATNVNITTGVPLPSGTYRLILT